MVSALLVVLPSSLSPQSTRQPQTIHHPAQLPNIYKHTCWVVINEAELFPSIWDDCQPEMGRVGKRGKTRVGARGRGSLVAGMVTGNYIVYLYSVL